MDLNSAEISKIQTSDTTIQSLMTSVALPSCIIADTGEKVTLAKCIHTHVSSYCSESIK